MFKGIYSTIFTVPDLPTVTSWYTAVLDKEPYISNNEYTGFHIGGMELGFQSGNSGSDTEPLVYFLVTDIEELTERIIDLGGAVEQPVLHIGGPVYTAICRDPFGNRLGLIENPRFRAT